MMFSYLSLLAVVAPLASALVINTPTNWTTGNEVTVTWTTTAGDNPVFSLELSNPIIFNEALALANNVDVSLQTLTFSLGIVAVTSGYTLQAVNITNIGQVYAQSGAFAIGDTVTTSSIASSTSSLTSGSSVIVPTATTSTTPFGVTVSSTGSSGSQTSGSPAASGSSSGAPSPSPSSFNGNGNGAFKTTGSWAALALGAVFGGVMAL